MLTPLARARQRIDELERRCHDLEAYMGFTNPRLWVWFDFGIENIEEVVTEVRSHRYTRAADYRRVAVWRVLFKNGQRRSFLKRWMDIPPVSFDFGIAAVIDTRVMVSKDGYSAIDPWNAQNVVFVNGATHLHLVARRAVAPWFDFGISSMADARNYGDHRAVVIFNFRDGKRMSAFSDCTMRECRARYWPDAIRRQRIPISFDFGISSVRLYGDPMYAGRYYYKVNFRNGQFYYFNAA